MTAFKKEGFPPLFCDDTKKGIIEIVRRDNSAICVSLSHHITRGKTEDGEKFDVDIDINHSRMVFAFPETLYTISIQSIIEAVLECRKQQVPDFIEKEFSDAKSEKARK